MQDNIWTKCAHFGRCTLEEQDKELKDRIAELEKEKAEQAKEIKGVKENLIEYGRHAAGCSQEYAKKHGCRCGWDAVGKVLKCDTP